MGASSRHHGDVTRLCRGLVDCQAESLGVCLLVLPEHRLGRTGDLPPDVGTCDFDDSLPGAVGLRSDLLEEERGRTVGFAVDEILQKMTELGGPDDVRLVFWFDN